MCCDPKEFRGYHGGHGHWSCCCTPQLFFRHFESSKEKRAKLEEYKAELEKELAGVEERIQGLKGE